MWWVLLKKHRGTFAGFLYDGETEKSADFKGLEQLVTEVDNFPGRRCVWGVL